MREGTIGDEERNGRYIAKGRRRRDGTVGDETKGKGDSKKGGKGEREQ